MGRFGILAGWRRRLPLVLVALLGIGTPLAGLASAQAAVTTAGGLTSVAPFRLLDTRLGLGAPKVAVAKGGIVHLQVAGRGGVPISGISAVVLNVTVTAPTRPGYVTVYGDGTPRPTASNLNFVPGQTVPNLLIAPVGPNGRVALYNGSIGTVQLVADVSGYYRSGAPSAAGAFGSLSPFRLLDTRSGLGAAKAAAVPAGGTLALQVAGRGFVPGSGASAAVLNVTVTAPARAGSVTVFASGTARPLANNVNFVAGQTVPNLVTAQLGADGKVSLHNGSPGTIHLVADVSGYYCAGTPSMAGMFGSLPQPRLLDTRTGLGAAKVAVARGGTVSLQVTGRGGVPAAGVSAVVLNVMAASATKPGYVTVYGAGAARPTASNLNFVVGRTTSNMVVVPVGAGGRVALYNGSIGTIALVADVSGWYLGSNAVPGPVTGLTATPGTTTMALSWTNPAQGSLTGVMIRRAEGSIPPSSALAGTLVAEVATPGTTFTDSGLTPGTQYSYALFAHDGTTPLPFYAAGATVTATTTAVGAPPGPVTHLTATPGNTTVLLSWDNPPQASLAGVMIRRASGAVAPASATDGTLVRDVSSPAATLTDSSLTPGTQYSYALFAHDSATPVPFFAAGATVTTTTATVVVPPGPVTGARATPGTTTMALSWTNPPETSLTAVMIRRAEGAIPPSSASAGTLVAEVATPGVTFADSGLTPGTQYSYALFAHDGATPVPFYASGATVTATTIPMPVTDVAATPGSNSIELTWTNPVAGSLTGVMIRRAQGGVPPASADAGTLVWDVDSPGARFTDTLLTPGTQYSYSLFAHNDTPGYAVAATATATTRAPGTLAGTVTDAGGSHHGLAHVNVNLRSVSTGINETVVTDANGHYSKALLPAAADYTVCFNASTATTGGTSDLLGYVDQCFDNRSILAVPTPVSVVSGTTRSDINAALIGGGGISGRVTDAAGSHAGLEKVDVTVRFGSGSTVIAGTATTDASGGYLVTGLAAGTDYAVCFTTSADTRGGSSDVTGYVDQCYRNQPTSGTRTPVPAAVGSVTAGIDAALNGGGAISGVVTDSAGSHPVLVGVDVSVYSPTVSLRSVTTDAHGVYHLPGLPGGTDYTVCFNGANATGGTYSFGYFDQCYSGAQTADQATLVSVFAGMTTPGINAVMLPRDESHT